MLSAEDFLAEVRCALPKTPETLSLTDPLAEVAIDKVSRAALQILFRRLIPGATRELIESIESLSDAYEWHRTTTGNVGERGSVEIRTALRPLHEADLMPLYDASCSVEQGFRWRFRGATPSFQEFMGGLYQGVLAQFVVADVHEGTPYGLVCAYNAQLEQQHVYIGFVRMNPAKGRGEVLEGMVSFIEFLFRTWNFRKLYAEVPEFNAKGMFDLGSRAVRVEGRLKDHCFHDGKWWDQLTVALWREDWVTERENWQVE